MEDLKIFDENGKVLHIGDVVSRLSPNTLDRIVLDLDEYARDYDSYEYGLPNFDKKSDEMRQIVITALNRL